MSNIKYQIKTQNIKFQFIGYWILVVFVVLVVFPKQVFAENIALSIYPPIITIQAIAPAEIKSPITITNEGSDPVEVTVGIRPFTQDEKNNGQPRYLLPTDRVGEDPQIYEKMSIFDGTGYTNTLTLAPNQKKNVQLRISLPTGESPGDYYFSIVFISKAVVNNHVGSAVSGGISTNVLLSVGPKGPTNGYLTEFSAPLFVDHGPVPFIVLVHNTSKHFIAPTGGIIIKNMFGQIEGKINLGQENILANTSRYLPDDSVRNIQYPISNIQYPLAMWDEKFLLGPYSATLTIALSGEGPLYRRTIYFFALPIQVLVGSILGIILVAVVVYRVKKKL